MPDFTYERLDGGLTRISVKTEKGLPIFQRFTDEKVVEVDELRANFILSCCTLPGHGYDFEVEEIIK